MIKRGHVRQFLAVVDAGSFTHAAARIHLTQPTLSAGIAELERLVGARLFVRDRRQVRLTEAGGRFLATARGIEREFRQLDEFARSAAPQWPDLKLGMVPSLAADHFKAVVGSLSGRYTIELVDGTDAELRSALASGRLHCALTLLRGDEPADTAIALYEEPYTMFAASDHPLVGNRLVEPEELASEIMIARRGCEMLAQTSRFFAGKGVRPRFAYRSLDDARCMLLVAAGQGLTTAPLSFGFEGVAPIRVRGYEFARRIGLVCDSHWLAQPGMAERFAAIGSDLQAALGGSIPPPAFP